MGGCQRIERNTAGAPALQTLSVLFGFVGSPALRYVCHPCVVRTSVLCTCYMPAARNKNPLERHLFTRERIACFYGATWRSRAGIDPGCGRGHNEAAFPEEGGSSMKLIAFNLNGKPASISADDPQMPLLYALRDDLGLHGPRFGCGLGQCGACTVHVDGQAVRSCSVPVS